MKIENVVPCTAMSRIKILKNPALMWFPYILKIQMNSSTTFITIKTQQDTPSKDKKIIGLLS